MVSKSTDEVEARTKRNYSKASREGDRRRPFQSELPPKLSAFFSSRKCSSIPAKSWHFCPKTCTSIFYELFIALIPYSWQKGHVFERNLWSIHCIDMVYMLSRYLIFHKLLQCLNNPSYKRLRLGRGVGSLVLT